MFSPRFIGLHNYNIRVIFRVLLGVSCRWRSHNNYSSGMCEVLPSLWRYLTLQRSQNITKIPGGLQLWLRRGRDGCGAMCEVPPPFWRHLTHQCSNNRAMRCARCRRLFGGTSHINAAKILPKFLGGSSCSGGGGKTSTQPERCNVLKASLGGCYIFYDALENNQKTMVFFL
jgi:hypothetical protein